MKKKLNCILLVDDNTADNRYHQIILKGMDITERIDVALDGEEALNYLKKENQTPPDLIILDINMPKVNGWEFLEAYHKLSPELKAKAIVVMLTTSENPEDKKKAEQFSEIRGFNSKPLTEEMVNEILKQFFPDYI